MPMTRPALFMRGPPESPGCSAALVSIRPLSRAGLPLSSATVIAFARPVMRPVAETIRPVPLAFPTALTVWPTTSFDAAAVVTILRLDAFASRSTATSSAAS